MLGASLVLTLQLVAQSAPPANPLALVDQLGSLRYADREGAGRALEELGAAALPALREGLGSRDMEVRTRAHALLQKIEGTLLTRPTLVRLDFRDAPLTEVAKRLSQRTGMRIGLFPAQNPRWQATRITLEDPAPIPFWAAIDRLCAAAAVQSDLELRGASMHGEPSLTLTDRITRPMQPTSDHGPFRVGLVELEFQRRVSFVAVPARPPGNFAALQGGDPAAAPQPRPVTSEQCSVQLQVSAEPRLGVSQSGLVQWLEARDELGNSLLPGTPGGPGPRPTTYLGGSCSSIVHVRAALNRPENAGKTIKVLRGVIPLRVVARQADPLVVPLAGAAGKSYDKGELHLTVHEIRSDPQRHQRQIELSVRSEAEAEGDDEGGVQSLSTPPDPHQQTIEVVDGQGRIVPWFQSHVDAESSRVTLTLARLPGNAEPRELRYYRVTETVVDVPFTFRDAPMP